jgi:hypothetical protein
MRNRVRRINYKSRSGEWNDSIKKRKEKTVANGTRSHNLGASGAHAFLLSHESSAFFWRFVIYMIRMSTPSQDLCPSQYQWISFIHSLAMMLLATSFLPIHPLSKACFVPLIDSEYSFPAVMVVANIRWTSVTGRSGRRSADLSERSIQSVQRCHLTEEDCRESRARIAW